VEIAEAVPEVFEVMVISPAQTALQQTIIRTAMVIFDFTRISLIEGSLIETQVPRHRHLARRRELRRSLVEMVISSMMNLSKIG